MARRTERVAFAVLLGTAAAAWADDVAVRMGKASGPPASGDGQGGLDNRVDSVRLS